ncbi:MAG: SDR family NAD(P)-dependent oxidoreductase [Betaproteobacteria bacterium]|nr:SDR family NAD(P)-dependent oxidoreductase [Betaproteobacteria bacterium]
MADQAGFTNSQASAQGRLQPHSSATESAKPCAWFGLQGKLALVTGASSGLGARFASVLAEQGCRLLLAARRVDRLQALAEQLRSEGAEVQVLAMDVTSLASIQAAIEQAHAQAGPIDILINNSGVSTTQRLTEVTESDYDYIFNTNTRGAFFADS